MEIQLDHAIVIISVSHFVTVVQIYMKSDAT